MLWVYFSRYKNEKVEIFIDSLYDHENKKLNTNVNVGPHPLHGGFLKSMMDRMKTLAKR
jgi:hypothetical protein